MATIFNQSITKDNLMRAFAGESQARNRYQFAASTARKLGYPVLESIFIFTAKQEKEHGEVFYQHLSELAGTKIKVDGDYPVDIYQDAVTLLRTAEKNEYEENRNIYPSFASVARAEGFPAIANSFQHIAEIEKTHAERFGRFADMLEQNTLFIADIAINWMCLNCGYVYFGTEAPLRCPVCNHEKGYFIRLDLAPFEH